MRITEKQLLVLIKVLEGSLAFEEGTGSSFGFSYKTRFELYNQILNQQSEILVEVKGTS